MRDRTGAATILTAFASVALLGFMAIGVDGAHYYVIKRRLQTATDMAAMAAASRMDTAATVAASIMASNGFPGATIRISPGTYVADATLAPAARFSTAMATNAVEVVSTTREAFIFGSALHALAGPAQAADAPTVAGGAIDGVAIGARAVARRQDVAAFTLGSGLASLDAGLLNAVLGSLLGTKLSFSLADYQSLASANLDLFSFCDTLAAQGLISGPTYGSFGTSLVSQSKLLNAMADTVQGNARAAAAFRWISIAVPPGPAQALGHLIDFGPAGDIRIGSSHPLSATVSAMDLLLAMAQLGGQRHVASIDLSAAIPGLVSTTLMATLGEPAVGSSFFAVGAEGATLHTAQLRLLLSTQIGGAGLPAALTVPIYLEVAPGTAALSSIACLGNAAGASVTLSVTPGLADVWIGTVQPSDFGSLVSAPPVHRATLANVLGLVRIDALGHEAPTAETATPVTFSSQQIQAATKKTVASTVSLEAALSDLTDQTQISAMALGLGVPQPQLPQAVKTALRNGLAPIDDALNRTLAIFGIAVGQSTVTVPGVHCGQGVLVN